MLQKSTYSYQKQYLAPKSALDLYSICANLFLFFFPFLSSLIFSSFYFVLLSFSRIFSIKQSPLNIMKPVHDQHLFIALFIHISQNIVLDYLTLFNLNVRLNPFID